MIGGFTVCVLFYGDHLGLAARCIDSICKCLDARLVLDVRLAYNEVSHRVQDYIDGALIRNRPDCPIYIYKSDTNVCKYPLMRRMLYDSERPLGSSHVMWFDDDSCITAGPGWWRKTYDEAVKYHMMGDVWYVTFDGKQKWVRNQHWYTGKVWKRIRGKEAMEFATGGWWTARTGFLHRWNYPWPELRHRGGDCTLGALIHQQGLQLGRYKKGLLINADERGRNSKAKRRGVDERPVWYDYDPDLAADDTHHEFDIRVLEI